MHAVTVNDKRSHDFEGERGDVYGGEGGLDEGKEMENAGIILYYQK